MRSFYPSIILPDGHNSLFSASDTNSSLHGPTGIRIMMSSIAQLGTRDTDALKVTDLQKSIHLMIAHHGLTDKPNLLQVNRALH